MKIVMLTLLTWALVAQAELPPRDLHVELRQLEETGGEQVVATQIQGMGLNSQQVQVRNGNQASFSVSQSIPMQWVRAVAAQATHLSKPNLQQQRSAVALEQGVSWLQAGQSLSVRARWPGGRQAVALEISVRSTSVSETAGAAGLPSQAHSELVTTVSAPLGQWVTVAVSGAPATAGVYGSEAGSDRRRLLQVRVQAP